MSKEKGGPGASQRTDGMWKKIGEKYNERNPSPHVPNDKDGRICVPRNVGSLISKWKRMKPFVTVHTMCEMLAIADPKFGESAQGLEDRAMLAYRRGKKGVEFPFLSLYEILKPEPKWQLHMNQHAEAAKQRVG